MSEKIYLTAEGIKQYKERLKELNDTVLPLAVERLKVARDFGDLSENAEYVAAKENLAKLTSEKEEIEAKLRVAVLYDKKISDKVELGVSVKVFNSALNKEFVYNIVGTAEADIYENKISNESPMGQSLLGKRVGDECVYTAPNGREYSIKILDINS